MCVGWQSILEQLEFVGRLERVVTTDRDERIDAE